MFYNDFGTFVWIWAILGARRAAGGAPRREMTRTRQPKAQKWAPFWDAFGSCKHHFSACVFMCFSGPLFIACFAVCDDFGKYFGRHLGSRGPWEMMPKFTTICIFRVWALLVRSPVRDLLLEGVWHAFCEIWVPIGVLMRTPCGHFWQLFQGLILEAVLGRQNGAQSSGSGWAGRQGRGR